MSWFSLVIGQNTSRQLATSSENLVASAQFLVALATSESQFRALILSGQSQNKVALDCLEMPAAFFSFRKF